MLDFGNFDNFFFSTTKLIKFRVLNINDPIIKEEFYLKKKNIFKLILIN